ncbi:MAG: ribosome maturation factor RimP [Lachnospiraceae bacterium]|nr:ribosome maturation factor RimP [Lachnospiraceae bacterium]
MAKREEIEQRTEALLLPVTKECGVRVYDVEFVKEGSDFFLRCYIDKEGGVTIDDCEKVSRRMSDLLDREDYIEDAYTLEVSSPGLGRKLTKDRHLEASLGEEVEVKLFKPPEGEKQKEFEGILRGFDEKSLTIAEGAPPDPEKERTFDRKNIAVIRLKLDF